MADTQFTLGELALLKSAYASGTLRIRYEDRMVDYASADDLLKRISFIESRLATNGPRPRAGFASFSRGE